MGNTKASLFLALAVLVVFTASAFAYTEVVSDGSDSESYFSFIEGMSNSAEIPIEDLYDLEYTEISAIIVKYKGQEEIVFVPETIDDKPVTGIGDGAFIKNTKIKEVHLPDTVTEMGISVFEKCSSLETVTLPSNITEISEKTFNECSSLNNVEIPDTVKTLGRLSFCDCLSLMHITVPEGVTELGQSVFWGSGLVTIDLPDTLSEIGKTAFNNCYELKEITIPEGVTVINAQTFWHCESMEYAHLPESLKKIEISAFVGCHSLKEAYISSNVTSISIYAFESCHSMTEYIVDEGNKRYESVDGILYDKNTKTLLFCPAMKEGHVKIKYGTESVNGRAFDRCKITEITIPDTVVRLGGSSFCDSALEYMWIPSSVTDIVGSNFSGCHQLTEIEVSRDNPVYSSVDGILYRDDGKTLFIAPPGKGGHIVVPEGVTEIRGSAFYVNYAITGITFPDSLTKIGSSSLWMCPNLTGVIIPAGVTEIGNYAFSRCDTLDYIIFLGNGMEQSYGPIPVEKTIYYLEGNTGFESWRNTHKIPVSSPDKVTGVHFNNNSSEPRFSWNYPVNNIGEITSYTISYREAGTDDLFEQIGTYDNADTAITGLKEDTYYQIRIVSENFAGSSENILSTKTLKTYSVHFDVNGGEGASPSAIHGDEGSSAPLPDGTGLSMTGHSFAGWSFTTEGSATGNWIVLNDNVTMYAVWKANEYTIHFETFGGTQIPSVTQYYGTGITVPDNPAKEGHSFEGWDRTIPDTVPAENLLINALWTVNLYNITWIVDDLELDIEVEYGSRINIPRFDDKEGHTFVDWDRTVPDTMPAADLAIKAIWSTNTYSVTWIVDGTQSVDYYDYGQNIDMF